MTRTIDLIVIHCAATPNLNPVSQKAIDASHKQRGFSRKREWRDLQRPDLVAFGYHFFVNVDGALSEGRHLDEVGAHVSGHNAKSIGICMAGTDDFSQEQWAALLELVRELKGMYPDAEICGHRDLSPDLDGDGGVSPYEWIKICPGFNARDWAAENGL